MEEIIGEMIAKRNQIVHIYDSEQAEKVYEFIKSEEVYSAIENIYLKLKQKFERRNAISPTSNTKV